jgi:hypothetical protein
LKAVGVTTTATTTTATTTTTTTTTQTVTISGLYASMISVYGYPFTATAWVTYTGSVEPVTVTITSVSLVSPALPYTMNFGSLITHTYVFNAPTISYYAGGGGVYTRYDDVVYIGTAAGGESTNTTTSGATVSVVITSTVYVAEFTTTRYYYREYIDGIAGYTDTVVYLTLWANYVQTAGPTAIESAVLVYTDTLVGVKSTTTIYGLSTWVIPASTTVYPLATLSLGYSPLSLTLYYYDSETITDPNNGITETRQDSEAIVIS